MSAAPKVLVIMGASRAGGETARTVERLTADRETEIVDLLDVRMSYYDYQYRNQDDDFLPISKKMIAADVIVFATPVYWYAMSAPMKILFDRFSDLVRIRKEDGRSLAGRDVYVLVNGSDEIIPEGYEVPFRKTCQYLDMNYQGVHYVHTGRNEGLRTATTEAIDAFAVRVFAVRRKDAA